jgi:Pectate lyase superfamily protein
MATLPTSNTGNTKAIDRTAGGSKPDSTPATGTTNTTITGAVTSVTGSIGVGASPTTGNVSVYLTTTGVTAATYGDSTHVPQIAVNAEGQITSASNVAISSAIPSGASTSQSLLYGNSSAPVWLTEHFNVKAFGATGDGTTDDHTAINAAIAALNSAGGGTLYFPKGNYYTSTILSQITQPCKICGDGISSSTITQHTLTAGVFLITTTSACVIRDLNITSTGTSTGYGISFNTSSFNESSLINNVSVSGFNVCLYLNAAFTVVDGCTFGTSSTACVYYTNATLPDESCGTIVNCTLNAGSSATQCIYMEADGLQILNNYFYASSLYAIVYNNSLVAAGYTGCSDLWIQNNHIEGYTSLAIWIKSPYGYAFNNVLITDNEFSPASGYASANAIQIDNQSASPAWISGHSYISFNYASYSGVNYLCFLAVSGTTPPPSDPSHWTPVAHWMQALTITGNVIDTAGTAISVNGVSNATINSNVIQSCTYPITLGSNTTGIVAAYNSFNTITNPNTDSGTTNYLGNNVGYTASFTLTGGSATETKYLNVTNSYLGKIPLGVFAQVTSDRTVGCYYNPSDGSNSSTQVAIVFFKYAGGNLSSGSISITARVGP